MKPKILFADRRPMSKESMELLRIAGDPVWASEEKESELIREMEDASIVITGLRLITRKAIFKARNLKGIVVYGVGFDHVDVKAATERKIYVANTPGTNAISVAEFAFGLMIDLSRNILRLNNKVNAGEWPHPGGLEGNELHGKTLGIIGLGNVGTYLAKLGEGSLMRMMCYTPHPSRDRTKEWRRAHGPAPIEFTDLNSLLKKSDFIVLSCALNDETVGLIGEREIGLLKQTAYIVNVARGSIVDEKALASALHEKRIAGAAIDVFNKEPPHPDNPLLNVENVIVTSHMAGLSKEAMERIQRTVAEEAVRILKGELPKNLVNKEILPN